MQIPAYAVGPAGLLTVPYLFRLFQEAAMQNTVSLKISTPELIETHGLSWVLRQQRITCERWPKMREPVSILTAPTGFERGLLTYRDVHLSDADDRPLISAVSEWLLMDVNTRKLKAIPPHILSLQQDFAPATAHLEKPSGKLKPPATVTAEIDRRVRYGMLDFNRHLTNPVFPELMLEPLGGEFLQSNLPTRLAITFLAEARYGDELRAIVGPGPEGGMAHALYREETLLAVMHSWWKTA